MKNSKDMKEEMEKWKDPNYRNLEFDFQEIGELEEEEEDREEEDEFEDEDFDVGTEILISVVSR